MLGSKILSYLLAFVVANLLYLMAEFQDIFCHPFLLSVLIIEGVGEWDEQWGGMERGGVGGVGWEVTKTTVWDTP